MRHTLKKSEILRGRNAFHDVLSGGRRANGAILKCTFSISDQTAGNGGEFHPGAVIGFAVSRKLSRAVDRNRVRRLMREAYRTQKEDLVGRLVASSRRAAIVFLYLPAPGQPALPSFHQIAADVKSILAAIINEARL